MIYSDVIITKKGEALIAKLHTSGLSTKLKYIALGAGINKLTEESIKLSDQKQVFQFDRVQQSEENKGKIIVQVAPNNIDLEDGYTIKEMGIFAEDPDEGDILYAVINTNDDAQEYDSFPAYRSDSDYKEIIFNIEIAVANAENVTFELSPESLKQEIRDISNNISNISAAQENMNIELHNVSDKADAAQKSADTATDIAKGKNRAHVFSTTEDMQTWLSNEENKGLYQVGDNLYIVDVGVPDWWISEVLDTVDEETGYYYKIAELETQKVDLTTITETLENQEEKISGLTSNLESLSSFYVDMDTEKITLTGVDSAAIQFQPPKRDGYEPVAAIVRSISGENGAYLVANARTNGWVSVCNCKSITISAVFTIRLFYKKIN